MNRNFLIVLVVALLVLAFAGYRFVNTTNSVDRLSTKIESDTANSLISEVKNKDSRRVLFFFANWCPTCKIADESLKENADRIPKDVEIIKVNYNDSDTDNSEEELARKYGITYQHTFVQIDENGNEVTKWNGGGIDELLSNIK